MPATQRRRSHSHHAKKKASAVRDINKSSRDASDSSVSPVKRDQLSSTSSIDQVLSSLAGEAVDALSQLSQSSSERDQHAKLADDIIPVTTFFEHIGVPAIDNIHSKRSARTRFTTLLPPNLPRIAAHPGDGVSDSQVTASDKNNVSPSTAQAAQCLLDLNR